MRISGSVSEINSLKDAINHGEDIDYSTHDPHAVAGLLKVNKNKKIRKKKKMRI